ncbi:ANM_HP_G0103790.mRNA.1.CDS.1 [Saccharomyces cerevisiae]|nr:ANM_HP_G0103790.mRNA.1.CDS.1 [Saccharomyces cerevisiae]CAI6424878.1 ANM_HP_G0103790.mRNA.1.CDS.1 [Saccharomyces cerevisiae]
MWQHGHFDHYPPGYDPTDPNRPKVQKAGQTRREDYRGIALSDNLGGSNYSRDSVVTEEIQ